MILRAGVETKKDRRIGLFRVPSGILSLSLKRLRRLRTQGSHPTGHKKEGDFLVSLFFVSLAVIYSSVHIEDSFELFQRVVSVA